MMSIKNGQSLKFWLTFGSVGGSLMLLNACSGDDNQAPQIVITPAPITAVTPRPTSTLGSTPIPVPTSFSPTATPTPGFSFTPTPAASLAPTTGNPTVAVTAPSVVFQSATTTVLGIVAAPAGLVGGNAFKVDVQTPISLSYVYPASAVGCATAATNCVASVPVLIPSTVPVGNYTLTLSVMDSQTRIATASQTISVIVNPLPSPSPAPSPSPTPVPSPTPSVSPSPVASPSPSPSPSRTPSP